MARSPPMTRVSEHFRLRDFVSRGQANVWPKYVVIREPLLDKLELVIQDLNSRGINAEGMRIQSGLPLERSGEMATGSSPRFVDLKSLLAPE